VWTPDRLDFNIIRELAGSPSQWNVKKSHAAIAKKLRVDEETVRNRLRRMKQEGYLQGWRLIPNPALIGRRAAFLLIGFEDSNTKEKAIDKLLHTDGVVVVAKFYDKTVIVTLFHENGQAQIAHEIQRTISAINGNPLTSWNASFPENLQKLEPLDWEILQRLMSDPERRLPELARELRISSRTAKRRINKMMASYAFFLIPIVNLRKIGGVPCQFIVECAEAKKREADKAIVAKFDEMTFRDIASPTHSVFGVTCTNIAEGEEIAKWIKTQPGVSTVWLNIVEEPIHSYEWLEKKVKARSNPTA